MSHSLTWRLGLLALAFSGLAVAACGGDESAALETGPLPTAPDDPSALTLSGEGYSFSHPQDWEWAGESGGSAGASIVSTLLLAPETEAYLPEPELLRVQVSRVPLAIEASQWGPDLSPEERSEYLNEVADVPRRVTADNLEQFAEWRVPDFMLAYDDIREGPFATTVDGLPALYLVAEGTDVQGRAIIAQSVLVFDGETEYMIDCEYSPAKEDEMRPGCAQVFDTFRLD